MTHTSSSATLSINDMGSDEGEKVAQPQAPESVLDKRKRRRKLNLKTLHGSLRESERAYRDFVEGRITASQYEVRSRGLYRHIQMANIAEQREQRERIIELLRARGNNQVGYDETLIALISGTPIEEVQVPE